MDFLPEFLPDKVVAGLERAVYFGQPPARREDFHGHLPVPFAGEETAVIVVKESKGFKKRLYGALERGHISGF